MHQGLATLLVVVTSAAVLVLEILGNRLVAPYVGLTLETYTASIGVALAAIALGAAVGGRLADLVDPRRWLGPATALGGALLLAARPSVLLLGPGTGGGPVATVVLVTCAVGPAAFVLSTVTPGVIKLRLRTLSETGQTVGRLSAVGTLGALAGTFLTGFVFLSALPTSRVLLLTGLLLLALGIALAVVLPRQGAVPPAGRGELTAVVVLGALSAGWLLAADSTCQRETRYYCASVVADPDREGGRTLILDGLRHSYVDLDDPAHLEFGYTRRIASVLAAAPDGPLDALHLGLGGGSVPRHLQAVRPGSRSTVLEVDPEVVRLDRDLLGLQTSPDLQVLVGDARTGIAEQPSASYDVVVGDAFGSLAVPWHLATTQMAEQVRRVLRPDGVYALNVIDNPPLDFVRAEAATLLEVFDDVLVLATPAQLEGRDGGNLVLVAGGSRLPREQLYDLAVAASPTQEDPDGWVVGEGEALAAGGRVLTDDDAPVDQLLTAYTTR